MAIVLAAEIIMSARHESTPSVQDCRTHALAPSATKHYYEKFRLCTTSALLRQRLRQEQWNKTQCELLLEDRTV